MANNSFDIVSTVDLQEVRNAIAQAEKEIATRYDLKKTGSKLELADDGIVLTAPDDYTLKAVRDVLEGRLVKREVPLKALSWGAVDQALGGTVKQRADLQQGIPTEKAREIVKLVKGTKLKVQTAIQGDQLRVTSKSKDILQETITFLKEGDFGLELQFENYR